MKFLHAADVHIDSPLRGLERYPGAPVDVLRGATRRAFENLIELAISQQVRFVILAGDLFDGPWQDMQTGIWTAQQFRKLQQHDIPVYLLRGNHDAESLVQQHIRWPDNVHQFGTSEATSFWLDDVSVGIHGQGFAQRETRDNLVAAYPEVRSGWLNIGVLHTSLTGNTDHDVYAPVALEQLVGKGYQYWALGHIHQRQVVHEFPHVVFPGNLQGRHIREVGAKGCCIVECSGTEVAQVHFHAIDTLRWQRVVVEARAEHDVGDLVTVIREQLQAAGGETDNRYRAVRIEVRGACVAHQRLSHPDQDDAFRAELRNVANEVDALTWVEKIVRDTSPAIDIDAVRRQPGLLGELLRDADALQTDEDRLRKLTEDFDDLARKAQLELSEAGIDLTDPQRVRRWLRDAETLLLTELLEADA